MEGLLQEILVFITFAIAVGYLFTKLVWKPKFLLFRKRKANSCGTGCGSCH